MHAIILERNKLVGRRVARWFAAAGATTATIEEPSALVATADTADVVCADAFDGDLVAELVRSHDRLHGVLWTAEPLRRTLRYLVEAPIDHVLARRDFDSAPHSWEVLMVARRLAGPTLHPPIAGFVEWGATVIELAVRTTSERDQAVTRIQEFVASLAVPRRIVEMFGELAHELVMNAMYDAPIDSDGHPKYAGDRKAAIELAEHERPRVRLASDGTRLVLQVSDPFGRLERHHVLDGFARGLGGGELDRAGGGAGLGLAMCHRAASAMIFDVARGHRTEVTAVFDLDLNLREFRSQAKSLHLWSS